VSLHVDPGEIVGVVGPNGAGKTTLVKIASTLLEPTSGRVLVGGHDVTRHASDARALLGTMLADDRVVYLRLTGRQNLEFFAAMAGLPRHVARQRADEVLVQLGLADRDRRVFGYSSGMRTLLNLGRAMLPRPPMLLLDEPTRSLDPLASRDIAAALRRVTDDGAALLLTSHRLEEVVALCDRVAVLVNGLVSFEGKPRDLDDGDGPVAALIALLAAEP
jgi:ABC-2 type transport system ATP-binding protein